MSEGNDAAAGNSAEKSTSTETTWFGLSTGTAAITIGPVVAFMLGYGYEHAFASARGIPREFISVRPESIAIGVASMGLSVVVFLGLLSYLVRRASPLTGAVGKSAWLGGFFLLMGLTFLVVNPFDWLGPATYCVLGVVELFAAWRYSKSATPPKPAAPDALIDEAGNVRLFHSLSPRLGGIIGILWFCSAFVLRHGTSAAMNEREFLVFTDETTGGEMVVIRSYGEVTVAANLDRDSKQVGPEYKVVKLDELKTLRRERLGRLETAKPIDSE